MTQVVNSFALLASGSRFEAMGSGLRGRQAQIQTGDILMFAAGLAVVILCVVLLARFVAHRDRNRSFHSPRALFRALAKTHGIDWRGRRLLMKMARWYRLEHAAQLFVQADRFEISRLGQELQKERGAVAALHERLFFDSSSEPPASIALQKGTAGPLAGQEKVMADSKIPSAGDADGTSGVSGEASQIVARH